MTDETRILEFHAGPLSRMARNPIDEIREAGLCISNYSYITAIQEQHIEEEDCDAMVFINYLKKNNVEFAIKETHIDYTTPYGA